MAGFELVAWLYDIPAGVIREARTGKLGLRYTDAALERWSYGDPVLSVALPLEPERRHPPGTVLPFLEGLLPEGDARTTLEEHFGVRRGDTFRLLAAIGRDCAGAVVFQPEGTEPLSQHPASLQLLDDDEIAAEIANLSAHPLGADDDVRVSLAGQQDKLLLTRTADGTWARPIGATPSTHILKPQDERFDRIVANESFCLRAAQALGLTTITVDELDADGRPVLVVSRYDRARTEDGAITRVHQEDFCRALSVPATDRNKYEEYGGPTLRSVANVLDRWAGTVDQLLTLARVMTFTVVIGNANAHGKNLSLLHAPGVGPRLAPLYDVMSTIQYETVLTKDGLRPVSTKLAMHVNNVIEINAVTVDDLVEEAASWHLDARQAREEINQMLDAVPDALMTAAGESPTLPDGMFERLQSRVHALRNGRHAGSARDE